MNEVIPVAEALELEVSELVVAPAAPAPMEEEGIWDYLVARIDEFAVAKAIVEHFDANPKDLGRAEIVEHDMLGIYMRAKVTIKRGQISYAQAQAAVEKARTSSRSVMGMARAFGAFLRSVADAVKANPGPVVVAVCMALMLWFR